LKNKEENGQARLDKRNQLPPPTPPRLRTHNITYSYGTSTWRLRLPLIWEPKGFKDYYRGTISKRRTSLIPRTTQPKSLQQRLYHCGSPGQSTQQQVKPIINLDRLSYKTQCKKKKCQI